jgi:hypothetical protein
MASKGTGARYHFRCWLKRASCGGKSIERKSMFQFVHIAALAALSVALASPVSAQSFQQESHYRDRAVLVGLTIPFGNGGSRTEREPRMELVFDHRQRDANGLEVRDALNHTANKPVRLGLTLTDRPHIMLNGREMPQMNDRKHISDGVLIGAGVVTVLGIGFYLLATGEFSGPTD